MREVGRSPVLPSALLAFALLFGSGAVAACAPRKPDQASVCETSLDQNELARRIGIITAAGEGFPGSGIFPSDAELQLMRGQTAAEYGLHMPDLTQLKEDLANPDMTADARVATVSAYTEKTYGFTVSAIINPDDEKTTRDDVDTLVAMLGEQPIELIQLERTSQVVLGSPEPGKIPVDEGDGKPHFASAFSQPDPDRPGWRRLVFGPGRVGVRGHEGGHNIYDMYLRLVCGDPGTAKDADFARANPPWFQYLSTPANWQRITLDAHGASSVSEDNPDFYQEILAADSLTSFIAACRAAQNSIYAEKMAIVSMRVDALDRSRNMGRYLATVLGKMCMAVRPS